MLLLDIAQLLELLFKLVDALASALVMLGDSDGLLLLLDLFLLFESDLAFVLLFTAFELS